MKIVNDTRICHSSVIPDICNRESSIFPFLFHLHSSTLFLPRANTVLHFLI